MTAPELSDRDREAIEAALAESGNLYMNMDARDCERLYLAGLLAGREQQWIPVSERLPETMTLVLAFSAKDGMYVALKRAPPYDYWCAVPGSYGRSPTHWMPLPNPPANRIEGWEP